jgi:protein-S-isoprenylcysteine O-methyltransferase Ste14
VAERRSLLARIARLRARLAEALARRRVALGFVCGAVVLGLAEPTATSLAVGLVIAGCGEAIRFWASGHLNKSREVTSSGPYRWCAHPLYVGSSVMGVGLAVASANLVVSALIAIYLTVTLTAAIRTEELFLRRTFGDRYDRYKHGDAPESPGMPGRAESDRPFSLAQAHANREHRALIGLGVAALLLVLKATYNGMFWRTGVRL